MSPVPVSFSSVFNPTRTLEFGRWVTLWAYQAQKFQSYIDFDAFDAGRTIIMVKTAKIKVLASADMARLTHFTISKKISSVVNGPVCQLILTKL
jgi:hypothetical protein